MKGFSWLSLVPPVLGLGLSLVAAALLLLLLGEKTTVLWEALYNSCFTDFGLGYTLFYMTPYLFTGLGVAVCFQCGLFNIGGEGQLYLGAIAIIAVSSAAPNAPGWVAVPLGILASACAGGFWGGIAGWLKAKRGSHEVIVTILLNFIAFAIVNYLILYQFDNPSSQSPETLDVGPGYRIASLNSLFAVFGLSFFESTPANVSLFMAIAAAFSAYFFLFHTPWGFSLRCVGKSIRASEFAGISVGRQTLIALALGGAFSGLVGINEVMGSQHKVIEGFSPQYGFTGIAVALLARSHPIGVIFSAFLFGVLQNSARELEFLSDKVTKELAVVIQAILIGFVAAQSVWGKPLLRLLQRAPEKNDD
jgi:general nucleoside transport system permease protein